jgi:tetratricopeptide (TPR) repeat protein
MLREGLRLHGAGHLAEAARCYQQAHLDDTGDPEALLMLGILARQTNQPAAAVELAAQAVHLRPHRAHYHLNLGLAYFAAGDYGAAEACYSAALALDSKLAQAWYSLGELAQTRQNPAIAEGCFQLAAAANPAHWRSALAHGNMLARQQKYCEATAVYACALELAPNEPDLHLAAGAAAAEFRLYAEAIAHYRRAIVLRPSFAEAHLMLGNALFDSGNFIAAALCYQQAIHLRPNYAKALCNLGNTLFKLDRMKEAVRCYERALLLDPTLDSVYNNLGNALVECRDLQRAESCFRTALALDPACAKYYNSLGNVLLKRNALREAESAYRSALALDPLYAIAHVNLATALMKLSRASEMVAHYQRGLALDPTSHGARYNLSIADLRAGRFRQGWLGHESRWDFPELRMRRRPFALEFGNTPAVPQWRGEPIAGKTILLHAEQGFGDTIQFVRYAPLVAALGAHVVLEVQSPLRTLLANLPGVDCLIARGDPLPAFDLHCPLLSLPFAFDTGVDTIPDTTPYLTVPAQSIAAARARFPSRENGPRSLRVGLVWAGNPKHSGDSQRSTTLRTLAPLVRVPGVTAISLQKGPATEQLHEAPDLQLLDADPALDDFAGTAALISTLDVLITVDTAAAHLAGALGVPVWLLLPYLADWRWLEGRTDSPWYPTARLFRQPAPGDWPALIARVAQSLRNHST